MVIEFVQLIIHPQNIFFQTAGCVDQVSGMENGVIQSALINNRKENNGEEKNATKE